MARVFLIAEAGVNHNGDLDVAKKLIDAAKSSGADAIKFQTFKTEELASFNAPKAKYQKKTVRNESQFKMLKRLELTNEQFENLFSYAKKKKIMFLSTPFCFESADFLKKLGLKYFKISSGDLTNLPLLRKIAGWKMPIILSTGMGSLDEIREAVEEIISKGNKRLILLHCVSSYPARFEDLNLNAIKTMKSEFGLPIGYSDHSLGIEASLAAVSIGAVVIEKHFTLDRNMSGPDHKASLEPVDYELMVKSIRNIEKSFGNGIKRPQRCELTMRKIVRKSLVSANDIPKHSKIEMSMLAIKRPGTGIAPKFLDRVVGSIALEKIEKDKTMKWRMLNEKAN
ncbi:MAG: N-acetylneuraminate synthase [Candidatus Saganbacteria bacterium]|nr:N-acetylneuraminate synthase [Candidatus Saganbacteria bacterium]